jgi:hypothetical protein
MLTASNVRMSVGVAGLLLGTLMAAGGARAQAKAPAAAVARAQAAALAPVIRELRATKVLLERADHDYKGHRAAAVKDIAVALRALGAHRHQGKKPAGNNEPQKLSDDQLRQAVVRLGVVQSQLANLPGPGAAKAAVALQAAVKELETALTIR